MAQKISFEELIEDAKTRVEEISVRELDDVDLTDVHLVDVREEGEWMRGRAENAIHLSKGLIEWKIEEVIPDRSALIICYCGGGMRSVLAAENLQRMGYRSVKSLRGGFRAWKKAGKPVVGRSGFLASVRGMFGK